jgi:hypothetical protein
MKTNTFAKYLKGITKTTRDLKHRSYRSGWEHDVNSSGSKPLAFTSSLHGSLALQRGQGSPDVLQGDVVPLTYGPDRRGPHMSSTSMLECRTSEELRPCKGIVVCIYMQVRKFDCTLKLTYMGMPYKIYFLWSTEASRKLLKPQHLGLLEVPYMNTWDPWIKCTIIKQTKFINSPSKVHHQINLHKHEKQDIW